MLLRSCKQASKQEKTKTNKKALEQNKFLSNVMFTSQSPRKCLALFICLRTSSFLLEHKLQGKGGKRRGNLMAVCDYRKVHDLGRLFYGSRRGVDQNISFFPGFRKKQKEEGKLLIFLIKEKHRGGPNYKIRHALFLLETKTTQFFCSLDNCNKFGRPKLTSFLLQNIFKPSK